LKPTASADYWTVPSKLGLSARVAILLGLFFVEKIFLTHFVDADRAGAALGVGEYFRHAQHFGFRFIVALVAALTVFAFTRAEPWKSLTSSATQMTYLRPGWMAAHLAFIACLAWLSSQLFPATPAMIPFGAIVGLWLVCSAAAILCALAAMAPLPLWLNAARALGNVWLFAAVAALVAATAIPLSEDLLWRPTTAATFHLVRLILQPILPGLVADPGSQVLGTQSFAVEILAYCSGLEGMSLILVFTIAWLWYFRREYRFPRALWLVPLGLTLMFGLNALRIAVLVLNPTAVFLMPLLAILAAGMLSRALSGRFEWFYPLRLVACVAVIVIYRHRLAALDWRWSWRGPLLGIGVFLIWFIAVHFLAPDAGMPEALAAASPPLRWGWIGCRVAGTVLTVPLAEELAYRGFLMRRLQSRDFDSLPYDRVGWFAVAVSSLLFGAAHGALWLPGSIAGFAYGWIVKRHGRLGEAVIAHLMTNLLVAVVALGSGNWAEF
jgi:CAAX prenyl protease-like protein